MTRNALLGICAGIGLLVSGCGGGGGSGSEPNWYYHFACNGDRECLSTNFASAPAGTSDQGPGAGGQAGCNGLLNFGNRFWTIPPAQQICNNSSSPPPAPTVSISVAPQGIFTGESATLTWSSANATSCSASGSWSGSKTLSGTQMVTPATGSHTYTLRCFGFNGSSSNSATLTVTPAPAVTISVSPASISSVQAATLTWSSISVTSCTASGAWTGAKTVSGSQTVSSLAPGSYTYTLTCTGSHGPASNSVMLTVRPPPAVSISVSPASVSVGQNAMLSWSSTDVTSCTATGPWSGSKTLSGSETVSSATAGSYAYTLSCTGAGGSASSSAVLTVGSSAQPAPTVSISVSPSSITESATATLSWSSTNVTSCTSSGSWTGPQALSGSQPVSPTAGTYAYALSCTGPGGTASNSATLTVLSSSTPPPSPTVAISVSPPGVNGGESARLTWSSTNASSCDASGTWTGSKVASGSESVTTPTAAGLYAYALTCTGSGGTGSNSATISVQPAPVSGTAARFSQPSGIATDTGNNIYVADRGNNTIRKITPEGTVTTLAGLAGASGYVDGTGIAARFSQPLAVAANRAGNVYEVEAFLHAIRQITPGGEVTTFVGSQNLGNTDGTGAAARFNNPGGLATDSADNLYVANLGANGTSSGGSIRKVTPARVVTTLAGGTTYGCTDGTGTGATFSNVSGIATDSAGNVIVADFNCGTIRKITAGGVVTTIAGTANMDGYADGTGTAARFHSPIGLALDSANNIYVADRTNRVIRKITPTGVVTTFAGTAGVAGSSDGTGAAARFNSPYGVATDSTNNVIVSDESSCTIRKITPAGVVTTIAGQSGCGSN